MTFSHLLCLYDDHLKSELQFHGHQTVGGVILWFIHNELLNFALCHEIDFHLLLCQQIFFLHSFPSYNPFHNLSYKPHGLILQNYTLNFPLIWEHFILFNLKAWLELRGQESSSHEQLYHVQQLHLHEQTLLDNILLRFTDFTDNLLFQRWSLLIENKFSNETCPNEFVISSIFPSTENNMFNTPPTEG